ncbi:MAG TPA: hypothetical protein VK836_20295 [Streptosporangiaceae bacterium]|nr:hypothetical protein [Streptosporangiaceae bacterium]
MHAPTDNITAPRSEQAADPSCPPASNLVRTWARGRRRFTPWAYPRLRALAAVRFAVGLFLVGLGSLMLSYGYHGWVAAVPLTGAALVFSIAYLDFTVARSASHRA